MKPDNAVIYFTVCSGTGYGIIVSLLSIMFNNEINIEFHIKFFIACLSFFLIISGLLASTIHLGHPKRAWSALSHWRSSWLSREGVAAIFTFIPLSVFFVSWIFTSNKILIYNFLIMSSFFSLITVFCTAKIYSSLKAIPAWNSPLVPIIYILNSLVLGSIITFTIFFYFEIKIKSLSNSIIIISLTTLCLKLLYWKLISKEKK
jgi:DMSO reductase anchor subunit